MFDKILVATDGSHSAEKAVDFAVELAATHGSHLVFCTVTKEQLVRLALAGEPDPTPEDTTFWGGVSEQGAEILRRAEATAQAADLDAYELSEVYGTNVGAAIVREAEAAGADHIVVGSIGATGVTRLLLGSVAASVIHHAHCPVTVVR